MGREPLFIREQKPPFWDDKKFLERWKEELPEMNEVKRGTNNPIEKEENKNNF